MNITKSAIFSVIIIACISCQKINRKELPFKFSIQVKTIKESVNYDDIVDSYKYIPLKTPANVKIGNVWKTLFYNNKIYVASYGIFCFDNKGGFLYSLDKMGNRTSEFSHIDDISIDNDNIYIYDNHLSKISIFNSENGSFLKDIKLMYSVMQLQAVNNILFMDKGLIPNPIITNEDLVISCKVNEQTSPKSFIPVDKYYWATNLQLYGYNKQVYWTDQIFNRVYKIYPDKIENYIFYDFGKKNVTVDEASGRSYELLARLKKAYKLENVYETDSLIFSNLLVGKDYVYAIYNKKSGKSLCYKNMNDKPYQTIPIANAIYGNFFCTLIPNDLVNILRIKTQEKQIEVHPGSKDFENYEKIKNSKPGDNPIIALYKLKI